MTEIINFFVEFFSGTYKVLTFLAGSIVNGIQFFFSTFLSIPTFILDLFYELPSFVQIGLSGVFGLLICVVILKFIALINL